MACSPSDSSPVSSAWVALVMQSSQSEPMFVRLVFNSFSCWVNVSRMIFSSSSISTKTSGDVGFCFFVFWSAEYLFSGAVLNHFSEQKECRVVAYACCLLHVVGDNYNGVLRL